MDSYWWRCCLLSIIKKMDGHELNRTRCHCYLRWVCQLRGKSNAQSYLVKRSVVANELLLQLQYYWIIIDIRKCLLTNSMMIIIIHAPLFTSVAPVPMERHYWQSQQNYWLCLEYVTVLTLNAFPTRVSPFQLQFDASNPFSGESVSIFQSRLIFFFVFFLLLIFCWESKQWKFTIQTCVVYDFHRFRCVHRRPHEMTCHGNVRMERDEWLFDYTY